MPQKQKKNKKKKYQNRAGGTREAHPPTGPLQRPHSESAAASMALKSRNPQGYFTADMNQVTALWPFSGSSETCVKGFNEVYQSFSFQELCWLNQIYMLAESWSTTL